MSSPGEIQRRRRLTTGDPRRKVWPPCVLVLLCVVTAAGSAADSSYEPEPLPGLVITMGSTLNRDRINVPSKDRTPWTAFRWDCQDLANVEVGTMRIFRSVVLIVPQTNSPALLERCQRLCRAFAGRRVTVTETGNASGAPLVFHYPPPVASEEQVLRALQVTCSPWALCPQGFLLICHAGDMTGFPDKSALPILPTLQLLFDETRIWSLLEYSSRSSSNVISVPVTLYLWQADQAPAQTLEPQDIGETKPVPNVPIHKLDDAVLARLAAERNWSRVLLQVEHKDLKSNYVLCLRRD